MPKLPSIDVLALNVKLIQNLLEKGYNKSVYLVDLYLAQIQKHDGYLHAMLSIPSKYRLQNVAAGQDEERFSGKLRSPLHGIPVVVKIVRSRSKVRDADSLNTHPNLGMKSTSGSLAHADA